MEGDLEGENEKVSEMFEVEDLAFMCVKSPGVHNRSLRRRDLFYPSALEMGIQFWRKEATCNTMLQMVDYNLTGDVLCQHQEWTSVITNIP